MPEGEVTTGELRRRMDRLEHHLDRQFENVNKRLDSLQFVRQDIHTRDMDALEHRIIVLEEKRKEEEADRLWNRRAVIISFILPILVGIIVARMILI